MNRTSAVEIIIQPLCPGPEVAASAPPLASGAPLVTYASRLASRCSIVGPAAAGAAAGAAAAGAGSAAGAVSALAGDDATQAAIEIANTTLAPRRRLTRIGGSPGHAGATRRDEIDATQITFPVCFERENPKTRSRSHPQPSTKSRDRSSSSRGRPRAIVHAGTKRLSDLDRLLTPS